MKKAAGKETENIATEPKKDTKYVEVRIPRFSFKNTSINSFLVLVLIIFAFTLGMLTNKVIYLETAAKTNAASLAAPTQAVANVPSQIPTPPNFVNVDAGHFPLKGNANAKVTVVEFGDLRCPFCERFFTNVEPNLIKDYVNTGKVKFAFRHYAFLGPASTVAANAAECANEQGKFWEFHDYLYQNQPSETDTSMYAVDSLTQIARTLGMNTDQFQSCLNSNKYDKNVSGDYTAAQQAQVDGTPTTFINGHRLVGALPYAEFQKLIDAELKK